MQRYVELIGDAATLLLIEAYPNVSVYIPARVTAKAPLARAIGVEAARAMAGHFGGETLLVPSAKGWRVRYYHRLGLRAREIARKVGWGERAVYRHIGRRDSLPSATPGQLRLL